jgi:hypothetical protein
LLLDVPGFEGIRIHAGNTDKDSDGCILVGELRGASSLLQSRAAYEPLFKQIRAAYDRGAAIWIDIVNEQPKVAA